MASGEATSVSSLADRLQTGIRDSGLFYESHLSRWYRGEVSRQQLEREPQMMRTLRFTPAPMAQGTGGSASGSPAMAHGTQSLVQAAQTMPGQPLTFSGSTPAAAGQGPAAQAVHSYSVTESLYPAAPRGERPAGDVQSAASGPGRDTGFAAVREGSEGGMREGLDPSLRARAGGGDPVHENLQGVVRHQLEMLVSPILRWEGDVWSGIFMALMIQLPAGARREGDESSQPDDGTQQETWHSEMQLSVPSLGEIRVGMWLQDQHVRLQLLSRDEASLDLLQAGVPELERRLRAAGLSTVLIDARRWEQEIPGTTHD
ncbi:MAG: flagellar hook-length control protein FliK [Halomonas sp.]|nr:flagellar hook-length control protein FliK [Halomonas sp.]MCC5883214.1 flagellar hook-length control protein FliK [Halomonas sp.]